MEEKMSDVFLMAHGLSNYNKMEAIRLYDRELKNNPQNIAALNNRGLCKLELAVENKDKKLLEESKIDFKKGIELIENKNREQPYIIDNNMKRAENTIID